MANFGRKSHCPVFDGTCFIPVYHIPTTNSLSLLSFLCHIYSSNCSPVSLSIDGNTNVIIIIFFLVSFIEKQLLITRKGSLSIDLLLLHFDFGLILYFGGTNEIPLVFIFYVQTRYLDGFSIFLRGSFPLLSIVPLESITKNMNLSYFIANAATAAAALLFWLEVAWPQSQKRRRE